MDSFIGVEGAVNLEGEGDPYLKKGFPFPPPNLPLFPRLL